MRVIPTFRVARVALSQVHLPGSGGPTLSFQPLDGISKAILALAGAQIPGALRHTVIIPRITGPERLIHPIIGRLQIRQHIIPPGQRNRSQPDRRSTFLDNLRLVLHPKERDIVVLDEAPVELQRAAARGETECAELTHRARNAARAPVVVEVAAALEEAVDGVRRARAGALVNGEVVVVGEGGRVDQGGKDRVDAVLVGGTRRVLQLRATTEDEGIGGGG